MAFKMLILKTSPASFVIVLVSLLLVQAEEKLGGQVDAIVEILKIAVPALLAYLVSRVQARKDQRLAQGSIEERTRAQLADQQEGIITEYRAVISSHQSMTDQARKVVMEAYQEAAEDKAARRLAEAKAQTLETELAALQRKYDNAMRELDELRQPKRRRQQRDESE